MRRENAHLYLPLVQALADGKTIQIKDLFNGKEWWEDIEQNGEVMFNMPPEYYRIKPEPRTFEMWLSSAGNMYPVSLYPNAIHCKRITVQEVLE